MRYLSLAEVLVLHRMVIEQTGGNPGIRDLGLLEGAVAQPRQTFDGSDLYRTLTDKAETLGFSLIANHPFTDGNKRVGHAALETVLMLNGHHLAGAVDEGEEVILKVASGGMDRDRFTRWVAAHVAAGP